MDTKLLLVKCITLLYRESQLPEKVHNSADLVTNAIALIKVPDAYIVNDFGRDPILALRDTVRWMAGNPINYTYDKTEFMQRLRVDSGNDTSLSESLLTACESELSEEDLKRVTVSYRSSVNEYVKRTEGVAILKKRYTQAAFQPQAVDWSSFFDEVIAELEPFSKPADNGSEHPAIVSNMMFNDRESVEKIFKSARNEQSDAGSIKTGWQGINNMLGGKGFRRGESILASALPHCYKSGFTLDVFMAAALFNIPQLRNIAKKPLLLRFSFENPNEMDIMHMYQSMVEQEFQIHVDRSTVDPVEATDYVIKKLQEPGWTINMVHIDPTNFGYRDLFNYIEKLESEGYEIVMLNMDYMNMMSKQGCTPGPHGSDVRDLARRIRNFTAKRGTIWITPHQMSGDAMGLRREGRESMVKEVAGKGYYDSCKTIWQEFDVEIYMDKVMDGADAYLEFQRGKHRGRVTPVEHHYCVYKFEPLGNIPFDVNGPNMSRRSVGGKPLSEGGGKAWWGPVLETR